MQMENFQGLSLTTLVDCLRRFWVYGLTAPRATAPEPFAAHEKSSADDTPPASPRSVLQGFLNAACVHALMLSAPWLVFWTAWAFATCRPQILYGHAAVRAY